MTPAEQKRAAKQFVERWKAKEGNEDQQSQAFWFEFYKDLLGVADPTHHIDFERRVRGRKIDVFDEDKGVLIEQKSRGIGLDDIRHTVTYGDETAYGQARWYYDHLIRSQKPKWIVTCNFDEFRIYDMENEYPEQSYTTIFLDDLERNIHLFNFMVDESASRITVEKDLSVKAGALVGKLYDELASQYINLDTDEHEQRSLNVVIVRLVFLLYAEDAGLLQKHLAFHDYMESFSARQSRQALIELFDVLDTPEEDRDPYLDETLAAFPYVNGGLFADRDIIIPQFTEQMLSDLLTEASAGFNWSGISPTIFGAVFESTINPETRRIGGMHYTSIENIHKVIDPLFLNELKAELANIEGDRVLRNKRIKLKKFQNKLASFTFLDPACGSGNFLTETYISLRRLENRVIEGLKENVTVAMGFEGDEAPIKISLTQFHGIEKNDFAVSVAKTALWIAESQMIAETQDIVYQVIDFLPLRSSANIVCANALRMDWNDVLPSEGCTFIIGNPPFVGTKRMTPEQKEDSRIVLGTLKNSGRLDYVACWYKKAADYTEGQKTQSAFVSTNSICQGEQVLSLWEPLLKQGIKLLFAHLPFKWSSEAINQAHAHVVIIGFSHEKPKEVLLFDGENATIVSQLNPYLVDAETIFVNNRKNPLCDVPPMELGCNLVDGGNYVFTRDEVEEFLKFEPQAERFIRPYMTAKDFLSKSPRYCLWLIDSVPEDYSDCPRVAEKVDLVRAFRLATPGKDSRKHADKPTIPVRCHYYSNDKHTDYLAFPRVSSDERQYIPIGWLEKNVIAGDTMCLIPYADLYIFGVLTSQFHNAWMRMVCGRLETRFRYSNSVVYNNFVWPDPTPEQREHIETCAQAILDIRDNYPDKSLANLYDSDKMPADLLAAHKALDKAVEEAYGVDFNGDEEKIVAHLFKLYTEKTKGELETVR